MPDSNSKLNVGENTSTTRLVISSVDEAFANNLSLQPGTIVYYDGSIRIWDGVEFT